MKRVVFLGVVASLVAVFLLPVAASAEAAKADVCHLNDVGGWQVNNVSERAVEAHLRHGDGLPGEAVPGMDRYSFDEGCVPMLVATGPALLAVAYSEVDQVPGFTAGDVLISAFEDVNGDGQPSIGDIIRTDEFPLDVDASSFGVFQETVHTITAISGYAHTSERFTVGVHTTTGGNQTFDWGAFSFREQYLEQHSVPSYAATGFGDTLTGLTNDWVVTRGSSASGPSVSPLDVQVNRPGDQDFFNVEVAPPTSTP